MEDVSVLSLLGRLVVSLAIVLMLMAVLARVLRNRTMPGMTRSAPKGTLQVVARQPLSRAASVAVVLAAGRALVLGVTDAGVHVLAEVDPATLEPEEGAEPPVTGPMQWKAVLDTLRERTVRR